MKKNALIVVCVTLLILTGNCLNSWCQVQKDVAFLKMVDVLSSQSSLEKHTDRIEILKDYNLKLIISDFKDFPLMGKIIENDKYILAPNADIIKTDAKFYIYPSELIVVKDSCYMEFAVINKRNLNIKGKISLTRNYAGEKFDINTAKTTYILSSYELK